MQNKKSLHWEYSQNNDNITLLLKGELSRETLLPLWQEYSSSSFLSKVNKQILLLDLDNLNRIDSAGFAFLCELIEKLNEKSKSLKIISYPEQFVILADLFGLTQWIKPFL